jgi:hypothetical protein
MVLLRSSAFALALAGLVRAQEQPITPLTDGEIASFSPYTYFASAGYCDASTTLNWTCGSASLATLSTAACSPDVLIIPF